MTRRTHQRPISESVLPPAPAPPEPVRVTQERGPEQRPSRDSGTQVALVPPPAPRPARARTSEYVSRLPPMSRDGAGRGRHVHDGQQRRSDRETGARGHGRTLHDRALARHDRRRAGLPGGQGLRLRAEWRRRPARHQRQLGRCAAIRDVARESDLQALPPAKRGRMGVCRSWRNDHRLLVGLADHARDHDLQRMRRPLRRLETREGRRLPGQCIRPPRRQRQRQPVGRRLLAEQLPESPARWLRLDLAAMPRARAARRIMAKRPRRGQGREPRLLRNRACAIRRTASGLPSANDRRPRCVRGCDAS